MRTRKTFFTHLFPSFSHETKVGIRAKVPNELDFPFRAYGDFNYLIIEFRPEHPVVDQPASHPTSNPAKHVGRSDDAQLVCWRDPPVCFNMKKIKA